MSTLDYAQAYYSASANSVLDLINPDTGKGVFCGQSLDEIRVAHPDAELLAFDEAYRRYNEGHCSTPTQITEDGFESAFGCMPPQRVGGAEEQMSFMLAELYAGEIGTFYVRLGKLGSQASAANRASRWTARSSRSAPTTSCRV